MTKKILILLFIVLSTLAIYASSFYEESNFLYFLFTGVYFLLLYSAIYMPKSYSYLFLSLFLFLGMWLKLTLHLIFGYAYVEPIGSFYTLHAKMDDVLVVAIIGALGMLSVNLFYRYKHTVSTIYIFENYICKKPLLYQIYNKYKFLVYIAISIMALSLMILNLLYNIQLSGVVPTTILLYPFNAIIYWVIGTGFSILLLVLFSLDIKFKNILNIKYLVLFAIIIAMTSIGLLSRGQYVFMVGSVIVFLLYNFRNLNELNIAKIFLYVLVVVFLYLFVIQSVSLLRDYYFSGASLSGVSLSGASLSGVSLSGASLSGLMGKILHLAVDRWIGLEGLMSVVSYEHKSFHLFFDALTTNPAIGKIDIYQYISNAHYKDMDNTKFAFATIPGALAFLYYTNSLVFVFFAIIILVYLMMIIEYFVYFWYKSALLTSVIGIYLANAIAQLGLMPINFLKSMFFTFSFLLLFKLLKLKKVNDENTD